MGKATILSHLGGGQYLIKIKFDNTLIEKRKIYIDAQVIAINTEINNIYTKKNTAKAQLDQDIQALNFYIDNTPVQDYVADPTAINKLTAKVYKSKSDYDIVIREEKHAKLKRTQLEKDKDYLVDYCPTEYETTAWCTQYKTDLNGDVDVVEVDYAHKRDTYTDVTKNDTGYWILNHPASEAAQLQHPLESSQHALWYNLAMLPAMQKDKARFRIAIATSINTTMHTCNVAYFGTVEIDPRSPDLISIKPIYPNLIDHHDQANIVYPPCHSHAFEENDKVIVDLHSGVGTPTVIGFYSDPRQCKGPFCTYQDRLSDRYSTVKNAMVHSNGFNPEQKTDFYSGNKSWTNAGKTLCVSWWVNIVYMNGFKQILPGTTWTDSNNIAQIDLIYECCYCNSDAMKAAHPGYDGFLIVIFNDRYDLHDNKRTNLGDDLIAPPNNLRIYGLTGVSVIAQISAITLPYIDHQHDHWGFLNDGLTLVSTKFFWDDPGSPPADINQWLYYYTFDALYTAITQSVKWSGSAGYFITDADWTCVIGGGMDPPGEGWKSFEPLRTRHTGGRSIVHIRITGDNFIATMFDESEHDGIRHSGTYSMATMISGAFSAIAGTVVSIINTGGDGDGETLTTIYPVFFDHETDFCAYIKHQSVFVQTTGPLVQRTDYTCELHIVYLGVDVIVDQYDDYYNTWDTIYGGVGHYKSGWIVTSPLVESDAVVQSGLLQNIGLRP